MKTKIVKTGLNYVIFFAVLIGLQPASARYACPAIEIAAYAVLHWQPRVDFAGEWLLNREEGYEPLPIEKLTIETSNDSLLVTMFPSKDHPVFDTPISMAYNYEGVETQYRGITSTVTWKERTMVIDNSLGETQDWNLSDDSKVLTIQFTGATGMGSICVFDRKE